MTGRNHHSNAMSCITEGSTGYPGGNGNIPFENGMLSEMLLQHGYNTYALGKWHLTPADQASAAGPYDRWPLGRGFERYYGFLGGDTHQYYPELVYDNHSVEPEKTPEEGYHLTEDLVDKAISFIADSKQVAPNKPFFMYFCPGAGHAPHHVPKEWADKYKGQFDDGWDAYREKTFARQKELGIIPQGRRTLAPRSRRAGLEHALGRREEALCPHDGGVRRIPDPHGLPLRPPVQLPEDDRRVGEHADHVHLRQRRQRGRRTARIGQREQVLQQRAGLSAKRTCRRSTSWAGPTTFNHYAWGWTFAGNTPFRRWKRETYRGGISDPFIVHWPKGIKAKGEIRTQYAHAIDMVPTVLEALGIEAPTSIKGVTQSPIQGLSFAHALDDAKAPSKHITQYFEMIGHRSIYHDGWRAVCPWPGTSFKEAGLPFGAPIDKDKLTELDAKGWELYHIDTDFAENHNVAAENRAKLIEMIATWYVEAGKYNVLPIDSRGQLRAADPRPQIAAARTSYTYYPGTQMVPGNAGPNVMNRPLQHHGGR